MRDEVRLLAASSDGLEHHRFTDLPDLLEPGDLLVVNTSATLPAALADAGGDAAAAPLDAAAGRVPGRRRTSAGSSSCATGIDAVPPRSRGRAARRSPAAARRSCWRRTWAGSGCGPPGSRSPSRCSPTSTSTASRSATATSPEPRPLADFQTSSRSSRAAPRCRAPAARSAAACSTRWARAACGSPPIVLHCGVSSLERGETPYPERFRSRPRPPRRVNAAARVIAVGTTVVRALETAAGGDAVSRAGRGSSSRPRPACSVVDGILTGWHEPGREPPADARGDRRPRPRRALVRRRARATATAGTSSATRTCCSP